MQRINVFILIISFLFSIGSSPIFSQQNRRTILGKVVDGQTFDPLPFANISLQNSDLGTTSDVKGNFIVNNNIDAKNLVISYVGYKSLIINVDSIPNNYEKVFYLLPISIYLQEVTVYSNVNQQSLSEISSLSMQSERIREISVGMPDIMRSIQSLPGIAVNNEFKAQFNVRGGNQDENLVLVNGTKVYEPFHIKEVTNASVGIFNVDLIKNVDLITGGFSARYGDKMSSVLNIQYREGNKEKFAGAVSLSLAYLDGYIEGPITDECSFILGIRKSYLEYVLSLIDYEDISSLKPLFYDVQGVLNYDFTPSNKILFEFIHSGDDFGYTPLKHKQASPTIGLLNNQSAEIITSRNQSEDDKADYYSNLFAIQSINLLSSKALLKGEISFYKQTDNEYRFYSSDDNEDYRILSSGTNFFNKLRTERLTYDTLDIETIEFKTDFAYQLATQYEINSGLSFQSIRYNHVLDDFFTYIQKNNFADSSVTVADTIKSPGVFSGKVPVDAKSFKYSAYIENIFQPADYLTFNIGGRIDYFDLNKDFTFSPRISASYNLNAQTTIRAAWGHYYQSPIYRQLKSSAASDTNTQSQMAIHHILGLEHSIFLNDNPNSFLKLKVEGYYKDYRNLISSSFTIFERLLYSGYNDAVGSAKGIDFFAVLNIPQFYCWLSYGLLYANEDKLTDDMGKYPRYTDQRHSFSFISNLDLGSEWSFSLKGYYGSGFPYTPKTAVNNNGIWEWQSGRIHSAHLPAYKRVDIRISKDFIYDNSTLNVFLDVSNVFNFRNIQNYEYKAPGFSKPVREEVLLWPVIPSLGLRYKF